LTSVCNRGIEKYILVQVHRGVIKSFFLADGCDAITSSTVDIDSIGINAYFTTLIGLCQDTCK